MRNPGQRLLHWFSHTHLSLPSTHPHVHQLSFKVFSSSVDVRFINTFHHTRYAGLLRIWFQLGMIYGIMMMLSSVFFYYYMYMNLNPSTRPLYSNTSSPGLAHYIVAFVLSSVVHEAGHALAALSEGIPIKSMGITWWGAFVDITTHDYLALHPVKRLRIICAGVWHNIVMAMCCYALLVHLPTLFAWIGFENHCITGSPVVLHIHKESSLSSHLNIYSNLVSLNHVSLNSSSLQQYHDFLHQTHVPVGFCVSEVDVLGSDCCKYVNESFPLGSSGALQCFTYNNDQYVCRSLTETVLHSTHCLSSSECQEGACLMPYIPSPHIGIIDIMTYQPPSRATLSLDNGWNRLVYIGDYGQLYRHVRLGCIVANGPSALFPYQLETELNVLIVMSVLLSIVNSAPAYYLDGSHALLALMDGIEHKRTKFLVYKVITFVTSLQWLGLGVNVIYSRMMESNT